MQDDDVQVDIARLWSFYDARHVCHAITPGHHQIYEGTGVTLIGWGAFFPKKLINFSKWEEAYGEVDPIEADRIFTYLAQPCYAWFSTVYQLSRSSKLSERPNHYHEKDRVIKMLHAMEDRT